MPSRLPSPSHFPAPRNRLAVPFLPSNDIFGLLCDTLAFFLSMSSPYYHNPSSLAILFLPSNDIPGLLCDTLAFFLSMSSPSYHNPSSLAVLFLPSMMRHHRHAIHDHRLHIVRTSFLLLPPQKRRKNNIYFAPPAVQLMHDGTTQLCI